MNNCQFVGRFIQDPVSVQDHNVNKTMFTIAVNREYRTSNNQVKRDTDQLNMELYDSAADLIMQNFKKGDLIFVSCEARSNRETEKIYFRVNKFYPLNTAKRGV